jgi:hypothetical protein
MASHESSASNSVAVAYTPFAAQSQRHQSPTDDGAASATGPVAAPGSRNSDPYYDNDGWLTDCPGSRLTSSMD